jgi:subfamily B ATP-binding cassette protein MsbA
VRNFLPLALIAIVTVRGIGSYLGSYYITYVARHVVNQLRVDVFAHINRLPAAYLAQRNSAELISLITFNIEQVAAAASTSIKVIVREGLTVVALLAYIFYLNWKLSLLFVVLAPVIGGIISFASAVQKYSRRIQDSMGDITRVAAEAIRGFAVVRGFGGTEAENARFEERSRYALKQDLKLARVDEISTPIIQWLTYSALAGLFWFGLDPAARQHGCGTVPRLHHRGQPRRQAPAPADAGQCADPARHRRRRERVRGARRGAGTRERQAPGDAPARRLRAQAAALSLPRRWREMRSAASI